MRCLLVLAMLAVAARGASISSSVSSSSSSDGRETTFSSHRVSNEEPSFTLGTRGSFSNFGSRQPAAVSPLGTRGSFGSRQSSAPGLSDVQAHLNLVASQLANAQSSLMG